MTRRDTATNKFRLVPQDQLNWVPTGPSGVLMQCCSHRGAAGLEQLSSAHPGPSSELSTQLVKPLHTRRGFKHSPLPHWYRWEAQRLRLPVSKKTCAGSNRCTCWCLMVRKLHNKLPSSVPIPTGKRNAHICTRPLHCDSPLCRRTSRTEGCTDCCLHTATGISCIWLVAPHSSDTDKEPSIENDTFLMSRLASFPWSSPSHLNHPCSRPRRHRATLSADTRGCLDISAVLGNEEVSHNPPRQNGRYSPGIHHISPPQRHTGHWHSDTGDSHKQSNLMGNKWNLMENSLE